MVIPNFGYGDGWRKIPGKVFLVLSKDIRGIIYEDYGVTRNY